MTFFINKEKFAICKHCNDCYVILTNYNYLVIAGLNFTPGDSNNKILCKNSPLFVNFNFSDEVTITIYLESKN